MCDCCRIDSVRGYKRRDERRLFIVQVLDSLANIAIRILRGWGRIRDSDGHVAVLSFFMSRIKGEDRHNFRDVGSSQHTATNTQRRRLWAGILQGWLGIIPR